MTFRQSGIAWGLALLLLGSGVPAAAQPAVTVAGVAYAPRVALAGTDLAFNGAGVRYKAVFQVYAAGLYLPGRADTLQDVAALAGPKRLSITMLRGIDSAELGTLFTRGIEDNLDKAAFSQIVPAVLRMGELFAATRRLAPGDQITVDWLPGTGTVITVKGQPQGEPFREAGFFEALMGIWLGPRPADWKLKDALLGRAG